MTHYETLGVPRGATLDEIKAAFRAKARHAHPDREGGSTEDMAAINRAYECLSDAQQRERYDRSGSDTPERPIEEEAREMLLGAFGSVMDNDGDWLTMASAILVGLRQQIDHRLADVAAKRGRIVKRRAKVKTKGENLVHMLIDQQIAAFVRQIEQLERAKRVQALAVQMLRAYEVEPDAAATASAWQQLGAASLGGIGWTGP